MIRSMKDKIEVSQKKEIKDKYNQYYQRRELKLQKRRKYLDKNFNTIFREYID